MKHYSYMEKPIRPEMLKLEEKRFDLSEGFTSNGEIHDFSKVVLREKVKTLLYFDLPDDFSFEIKNKDGSLYERLRKYALSEIGADYDKKYYLRRVIRPEVDRMIGMTRKSHIIDWTFHIKWRSGDFGDSGSCYFPATGGYVSCMHRNGVGAIRRFSDMFKGSGNARAWLAVDQPENGYITIYNRYGSSASCSYFASLLSCLLSNLGIGEFRYNILDSINCVGSAHLNGDAVVLYKKYLEPINYVTLQLARENLNGRD